MAHHWVGQTINWIYAMAHNSTKDSGKGLGEQKHSKEFLVKNYNVIKRALPL
jgi:hypothetical protein